jgi:hypothetical protein
MKISRRKILTGAVTASVCSPAVPCAQGVVAKIILAVGQSNMLSYYTANQPYPGGWVDDPNIRIWNQAAQWIQNYNPGVNSAGNASGAYWGPEGEYCRQRRLERLGESPLIITKVVGAPFYPKDTMPSWHPGSVAKDYFGTLIDQATFTREIAQYLYGATPIYDVMLVFGGEDDASTSPFWGTSFRDHFLTFENAIKTALDSPNMRVIITRIFPAWGGGYGLRVRSLQEQLGTLPGHAWVNIDDVQSADSGYHVSVEGAKETGRRMWLADSAIIPP